MALLSWFILACVTNHLQEAEFAYCRLNIEYFWSDWFLERISSESVRLQPLISHTIREMRPILAAKSGGLKGLLLLHTWLAYTPGGIAELFDFVKTYYEMIDNRFIMTVVGGLELCSIAETCMFYHEEEFKKLFKANLQFFKNLKELVEGRGDKPYEKINRIISMMSKHSIMLEAQ